MRHARWSKRCSGYCMATAKVLHPVFHQKLGPGAGASEPEREGELNKIIFAFYRLLGSALHEGYLESADIWDCHCTSLYTHGENATREPALGCKMHSVLRRRLAVRSEEHTSELQS